MHTEELQALVTFKGSWKMQATLQKIHYQNKRPVVKDWNVTGAEPYSILKNNSPTHQHTALCGESVQWTIVTFGSR
jgi:hypothetical protein